MLELIPRPLIDKLGGYSLFFKYSHGEVGQLSRAIIKSCGDSVFARSSRNETLAVECLIFNLILATLTEARYGTACSILISRRNKHYCKPPAVYRYPFIRRTSMIAALDSFEAAGYLTLRGGGVTRTAEGDPRFATGLCTRLRPTAAFAELLDRYADSLVYRQIREQGRLLLRDGATYKLKHYSLGGHVLDMHQLLGQINDNNSKHTYEYTLNYGSSVSVPLLNTHTSTTHLLHTGTRSAIPLSFRGDNPFARIAPNKVRMDPRSVQFNRVFNDDWELGGRFYAEHQNIHREERLTLTIDGEPTVELDYGALHPTMLYHLEGIQPIGKPYLVAGIAQENRAAAKVALLVVFNSASRKQAAKAIQREFQENSIKLTGLTIDELLDLLLAGHAAIAKYFFSGVGLTLQNLDARVAENIMLAFARQDRPCLGVHDSFVVKESDADMLRYQMEVCYQLVMRRAARGTAYADWAPLIDAKTKPHVQTEVAG
jgi:hypothetical protein